MTRTIPSTRVLLRIAALTWVVLASSASARAQAVDPTFNPGASDNIEALAIQPDGKILVGGQFATIGGGGTGTTARRKIARLNADGSVDTGFQAPYVSLSAVSDIALQVDGKIVIGGDFVDVSGCFHICRLNADGSLDTGFNPGANYFVWAIAVQADGKILVGGGFTALGGSGTTTRNHIGRLNADGSLDEGFDPGANGGVNYLLGQPDGKILVAGGFTTIGGGTGTTTRNRIARLNADGSVDMTFDPGATGDVYTMALQPDGKILVAGAFTMLGGGGTGTTTRNRVGRLNADGSVDMTFDPGANGDVYTMALQPDGKILVAGAFTMLGGGGTGTTTRNRVGRLNADGSLDTTFNPGADSIVQTAVVQPDGAVLVGGSFTKLGGGTGTIARSRIGRILAVPPVAPSITSHPTDSTVTSGTTATFSAAATGWPDAPTVQWQVSSDAGSTWTNVSGATSTTYSFTPNFSVNGRRYRAVFTNSGGQATTSGALLTVIPVPPVILTHPIDKITGVHVPVTFTASASGYSSMSWQVSRNGGPWDNLSHSNATTWLVNPSADMNGNRYRAVFTSVEGSTATSAAVLVLHAMSGGDFDGDLASDIAIYRRTTGFWYVAGGPWVQYGGPGYVPVAGDYDGDGTADIAVYGPSSGWWYVRNQFWAQFGDPGDIPVPGDYDGNGTTDLAVFRPSTGGWYVRNQLGIVGFGAPGDVPVVADYDGNGTTDIAVYRPSTGYWYVRNQFAIRFGFPGDLPVPGDYDGDGKHDVAVYNPSTGWWAVRNKFVREFGSPGDLPVHRDYDGDGDTDVAVYRPSTGRWYVYGQATTTQFGEPGDVPVPQTPQLSDLVNGDYDGDRATNLATFSNSTGRWRVRNRADVVYGDASDIAVPADYDGDAVMDIAVWRASTATWYVRDQFTVQFGEPGDLPVPGDYSGQGFATVAVYRPSTGVWYVRDHLPLQFGEPGDVPVPADYDGDGITDIAVYRPSTGVWYVWNQPRLCVPFGGPGWTPVPGDYNGDGVTDLAVFDTATGTWNVRGQFTIAFGDGTDTPVPGDYDGDGATDVAVFRSSTATWYVLDQFAIVFGDPGDVPVVGIGGNR